MLWLLVRKYLCPALILCLICLDVEAACTAPAGVEGQIRYDSGAKGLFFCDGASWRPAGSMPTYTHVSNNFNLPLLGEQVRSVSCPAGKTVVGGGCSSASALSMLSISDSYPSGGTSWNCRGSVLGLGVVLTVYAICAG
jgi:hypothetical protein